MTLYAVYGYKEDGTKVFIEVQSNADRAKWLCMGLNELGIKTEIETYNAEQ